MRSSKRTGTLLRLVAAALIAVLALSACAPAATPAQPNASAEQAEKPDGAEVNPGEEGENEKVITDHLDRRVRLPKSIERIAICDIYPLPSVLSIFFDSADKIVGMAENSMTAAKNSLLSELYPEITKAQTGYMNGSKVNIEELMSLKPDIVFYSATDTNIGTQLENAGVCAVAVSVNKWGYNAIETLDNWISLLSEIFPDNDKADKVAAYSEKVYKLVSERVSSLSEDERARVFFLFQYTDSLISTSGARFFGQWWAEAIGAKNVAEEIDKDNSAEVSMEQIYAWDPSLIFITNFNKFKPEDIYNNTVGTFDWSGIQAARDKRVYKMPLGMYRSYTPGVDTPITLLWLASEAYPELFSDIDIIKEAKTYYKEVFGVELTDTQAHSIFAPSASAGAELK